MFAGVLASSQISKIHEQSLAILAEVGVEIPHVDVLKLFDDAGARVDHSSQRVRIGPHMIERCLGSAGKRFTLYGRDIDRRAVFGHGERNYNTSAGEASWVDEPGGVRRRPTLEDAASAARLGDALDTITIAGAMADPHELPAGNRCVEVFATLLKNTVKPVTFWFHDRSAARFINEIMIAVRGDESRAAKYPLCYPFLEPISPLRFPFNGVDLLYETCRLNLPVFIGPMAQTGMSAPATVAGTMALENAEILAGVCISQLIAPGVPVCYGGICHAFDMQTTQTVFSGPEQAIFGVAMTQMGKHYGLPVYINVGLADAKRPDAQAGLEVGMTLALGAAAGADIFGHMGISGADQAASLDMLAMQHEAIRYVESVMRELDFSDEKFSFDEIMAAGPGGSYIDRDHTVAHFRREIWQPCLLDRRFYEAWRADGAAPMEQRCCRFRRELLSSHRPVPLDDALSAAVDGIVGAARTESR